MPKLYIVVTGTHVEISALQQQKPPAVLMSYYYVRRASKSIPNLVEKMGYRPEIMLDSGAYSAWTKGIEINVRDYMQFIIDHQEYLTHYISLDVVGDPSLSWDNYAIMRSHGFNPIPVFHYGTEEKWLQGYIIAGHKYICLGGAVGLKQTIKRAWVDHLLSTYPDMGFHLLGSSAKQFTGSKLRSSDSTTWIIGANMGQPRHIIGKNAEMRVVRASYNIDAELRMFGNRR